MQKIIDEEVQQMEDEGITEPSSSAWSSPVVIVRKKDSKRFCIDFCCLTLPLLLTNFAARAIYLLAIGRYLSPPKADP
ncbi:hypothetical protein P5V15_015882 [Pogonomyrmex californicus]